ncbi:hypothetical protein F4804DRAFT_309920 [Jackrogersella minutella]|nr:hypothetical protein F4804DRAFT_309920 [Jackrogersella minutella]
MLPYYIVLLILFPYLFLLKSQTGPPSTPPRVGLFSLVLPFLILFLMFPLRSAENTEHGIRHNAYAGHTCF